MIPTLNLPPQQAELRQLLTELRGLVLLHQAVGVEGYPDSPGLQRLLTPPIREQRSAPARTPAKSRPTGEAASLHPAPRAASVTAPGATPGPLPGSTPAPANRRGDSPRAEQPVNNRAPESELATLAQKFGECCGCPRHQQRQRIVFGQGNPRARLLIVGPAPGPAEEAAGLPCQGEGGALLDRMLAAIKLNREMVYLTGLVKCPSPSSQPPPPDEVRECLPHLLSQIAALKPALICTLGQESAQALLGSKRNLLQLRGKFHNCRGIPLMPTLAPDFLLLNPEMKKAAWEDLQMIQRRLARQSGAGDQGAPPVV